MGGKVYLSGPISGLTYQEARYGWRASFNAQLDEGITALSPMRHEGHLAEIKGTLEKAYPDNLFSRPKMIVAKDFLDIKLSDIVIANFEFAKRPSVGTFVELGYAKALGKTIIVIKNDDTDAIYNHPFIDEVADIIVSTVDEAAVIVNSLLSEGV